jgi:Ferritin-like domain
MKNSVTANRSAVNRRSFMKSGLMAGGAATLSAGLLSNSDSARAQEQYATGRLNRGDAAILRFLAAAELIEADLWTQYAELGGLTSGQPIEVDPNQPLNAYQNALSQLDPDGPQYITSNTLDEVSHATFLNAYLKSKGAEEVDFKKFANLQGSTATGSSGKGRLTNLMHLNVDTSWYVRYRSTTNPDLGATFPQAITLKDVTTIPVDNNDNRNSTQAETNHIQAIANSAAFHFGSIEQGGASLYAALSRKVTHPEVLRITLSIGGDEIAHFLEWVDFSGNGVQPPVAPFTDSQTGLTFPNFFDPLNPLIQPSLIFPVPCEFISPSLPKVAIIRPTSDEFGGAMAAANFLTASGLFEGQSQEFLDLLQEMAFEADQAYRR